MAGLSGACARRVPAGPRNSGSNSRRNAAGLEPVGVHREAHRTARLAPLEAGGEENLIQPFGFRLLLHIPSRTIIAPTWDATLRPFFQLTLDDLGGVPQILDAPVGARADKRPIDLDIARAVPGFRSI